ncbi:MAG: molybdate ABC transporter substrate-binding protein, partial [Bryobacteraceae bacterium]
MTSSYAGVRALLLTGVLACNACHQERSPEPNAITVAAAANLAQAFEEIRAAFSLKTGIEVTYSHGATTLLSEQIRNAAPFDVFAAADTEHVDALVSEGKILRDSRAVYARGGLA